MSKQLLTSCSGVIVNLFSEVRRLNSEQLYACLAEFTGSADRNERGAIEDDVLKLNTTMLPLHAALDIFNNADKTKSISFDKYGKTDHIFFQSLRTMQPRATQIANTLLTGVSVEAENLQQTPISVRPSDGVTLLEGFVSEKAR